jgi:hypothetical protein
MNPGLVWLLRRSPLTFTRGLRRRFRGVKGALLAVGIGIVMLAVLAPAVIDTILREQDSAQAAQRARLYGPLAMLMMTGMTLLAPAQRRGGLYFRPAEVGLLFPAPLSRRELLAYHVLSRAQIQVLSGLWVTLFVVRYAPTWYGCLAGVTLALLFLQLLSQALALLTAAAGKRLRWPIRWGALTAVVAVLGLGAVDAIAAARLDLGAEAAVAALRDHPAVIVLTAPFEPFVGAFAAETFAEAFGWSAASFALVLLVVLVIARLDVAYEEAALDVSRNVRRKLERMRTGGGALAAMGPSKARFGVPRLPFASGAGPIAWRQCVEIVRNVRAVVTSFLLLLLWPALMGGVMFFTAGDGTDGDSIQKMGAALLPMLIVFSIVSTQNIGFDFRRDLDRIPFLRSLPVTPFAIAAGQVGPSALLLALMQWVTIGVVVVLTDLLPLVAVPAILPALLPLAWAVLAIDNALFLLFPHRIDPDDAGNVGFVGRLMLVMFLKFVVLGALAVAAGGLGALAGFLLGKSLVVGVLVAMAVIVAADVVLTWLVARAYAAFDPGRDTPA